MTVAKKVSAGRFGVTPIQIAALDDLTHEANAAGHVTMCRQDAAWWSLEPPRGEAEREAWREERAAHCHACPVLVQCRELLATGMRVDGVTAGVHYDDGEIVSRGGGRPKREASTAVRVPGVVKHGTAHAYTRRKCRCEECREWCAEASRRRREKARQVAS